MSQKISVPDIGDFKNVEVIDVLVKAGDKIALETPLITLETEKATIDVPATAEGVVKSVAIKKGDRVSKGSLIVEVEDGPAGVGREAGSEKTPAGETPAPSPAASPQVPKPSSPSTQTPSPQAFTPSGPSSQTPSPQALTPTSPSSQTPSPQALTPTSPSSHAYNFDVVVLGAGPGGYTAAFRAADLGMKVALIERWPSLGGVCLNVGCIPSKALLHAAKVIAEAEEMSAHGVVFAKPTIDAVKLRDWKSSVVKKLTSGLTVLTKQRKIEVIKGVGKFVSAHEVEVTPEGSSSPQTNPSPQPSATAPGVALPPASMQSSPSRGEGVSEMKSSSSLTSPLAGEVARSAGEGSPRRISFNQCIIAAGSESVRLPGWPDDPRIIDSTGALELDLPQRLLVVGGGIIGLEMATVYAALGVKVSIVELTDGLIPGCDRDLVRPLEKRVAKRYERIMVSTKVTKVEALKEGIRVTFEGAQAIEPQVYDKVLVAVGRSPNGKRINAEAAGVLVNERGFVPVDPQMRTNVAHIFAIGDIAGPPMLAHKASHEGKLAAEVAHGEKHFFDARVIPAVAYTDPEIAWVGVTETEAKAKNIEFGKGTFPWIASGRSLSIGRDEGFTKLLFDPQTHRVIGGAAVGPNAGELIAEIGLAIEMGADASDIGLTIHAHPTLSETVAFAAEAFEGTLTDLYIPKKKS